MTENKFWISIWSILGLIVLGGISLGVYSGYLNDKRDLTFAAEELQPYVVERCSNVATYTEWHEAGWSDTSKGNTL